MQKIDVSRLEQALQSFNGKSAYFHMEVTPGGFARNIKVNIEEGYFAGDGPYRAALRLEDGGWIRVEGLTHFQIDSEGCLLLAGHDDLGRLTTALNISLKPLAF